MSDKAVNEKGRRDTNTNTAPTAAKAGGQSKAGGQDPAAQDLSTKNIRVLNDANSPDAIAITLDGDKLITQPEKPKRDRSKDKSRSKANVSKAETVKDVTQLICAGTGLAAMMIDPVWDISEPEAKSIAEPLVNIFERYNLLEKMANASDGIMLVTALSITFIPRYIMYKQKQEQIIETAPEVKKNAKSRTKSEPKNPTATTSPNEPNQPNNGGHDGTSGNLSSGGAAIKAASSVANM